MGTAVCITSSAYSLVHVMLETRIEEKAISCGCGWDVKQVTLRLVPLAAREQGSLALFPGLSVLASTPLNITGLLMVCIKLFPLQNVVYIW